MQKANYILMFNRTKVLLHPFLNNSLYYDQTFERNLNVSAHYENIIQQICEPLESNPRQSRPRAYNTPRHLSLPSSHILTNELINTAGLVSSLTCNSSNTNLSFSPAALLLKFIWAHMRLHTVLRESCTNYTSEEGRETLNER